MSLGGPYENPTDQSLNLPFTGSKMAPLGPKDSASKQEHTSWRFQPHWKICSSKCKSSPIFQGRKPKYERVATTQNTSFTSESLKTARSVLPSWCHCGPTCTTPSVSWKNPATTVDFLGKVEQTSRFLRLLGKVAKSQTPSILFFLLGTKNLRKIQTPGTDPRYHKIQIWREFLHEQVVMGLGYVPRVCWSFLRKIQTTTNVGKNILTARSGSSSCPRVCLDLKMKIEETHLISNTTIASCWFQPH